MAYGMRVEFSPSWKRVERALRHEVTPIVREEQLMLVAAAAVSARKTAKDFLDHYVYNAPLPPSAEDSWGGPEHYLERSRIGRTMDAIKDEPVEKEGEITASRAYVDTTDYPAFFYALSLEYGMEDKFPTYYPRPFWRDTIAVSRALYGREGELAEHRIVGRIKGRFA